MGKCIKFELNISGMTEEMYSSKIMIYKPYKTVELTYSLDDCIANGISKVSNIIDVVRHANTVSETPFFDYSMDDCSFLTIYIKYGDCLLGLGEDKSLLELFDCFRENTLSFVYMFVAGGASIGHRGYKFVVHSDEYVHKDSPHPHVHVIKDGVSVRYYLDTFERFAQDEPTHAHRRDERRIIKPFLKNNQKRLLNYWKLAMQGFVPPAENEKGEQFYPES